MLSSQSDNQLCLRKSIVHFSLFMVDNSNLQQVQMWQAVATSIIPFFPLCLPIWRECSVGVLSLFQQHQQTELTTQWSLVKQEKFKLTRGSSENSAWVDANNSQCPFLEKFRATLITNGAFTPQVNTWKSGVVVLTIKNRDSGCASCTVRVNKWQNNFRIYHYP